MKRLFAVLTLLAVLIVAGCGGGGSPRRAIPPRVHLSPLSTDTPVFVTTGRPPVARHSPFRFTLPSAPVVGEILTASTGTWTNNPTSFTYQWQRCSPSCVAISAATSSTYTVGSGDVGDTIDVVVTAHNAYGQASQTSAQTGTVTSPAPTNAALPAVSGTATQGQVLTATTGTWNNIPTSFTYQWQDCNSSGASCTNISAATSSTYTLVSGDVGSTVEVKVTATNAAGSAPANSLPTTVVTANTATFGVTAIGGTVGSPGMSADTKRVIKATAGASAQVTKLSMYLTPSGSVGTESLRGIIYADSPGAPGALLATSSELLFSNTNTTGWYDLTLPTSLSVTSGTAYWIGVITGGNADIAEYSYDTSASSRDFNSDTYVGGATDPFGTPTVDNQSMSIYASLTASGAPTNTVLPSSSDTITSGAYVQGDTLTANHGTWTGTPTSYAYQWKDCDSGGINCVNIPGATSSTYILAGTDLGSTIKVVATATNASGSASAISAASIAVTSGGGGTQTCDSTINPESFATAVSSATAGTTVCMNSGSYAGGTVSSAKASMTTFVAKTGQSPTIGFTVFNAASNITVQNATMTGGASVGNGFSDTGSTSTHIHFIGDAFNAGLCINTAQSINQDTLVDHSTFINGGQSCGEGRIEVIGLASNTNTGVVISHDLFGNPSGPATGSADGVQLAGGSRGTQVLSNEFLNIVQGGQHATTCDILIAHCDAIQFYGASGTVVSGNYFKGNATGLGSYNGNGSPFTWTNNVIDQPSQYSGGTIYVTGGSGDTITHNTAYSTPYSSLTLNGSNGGQSNNETVRDNIFLSGINAGAGTGNTFDYNLIPGGGTGAHTINGTPTFSGGSEPSTYAGWALAGGSLGLGTASDGGNIGASVSVAPGP